jgi:threonine/homoserine/homoserine lactone efflux protein
MHPLLIPFLSYSFLTIFTPGPSNVSASALGSKIGYRKSIPYIAGMSIAFFIILTASGLLADFLRENYSKIALYLRWIGAAYILWLAISLFVPPHKDKNNKPNDMGFVSGFLLVLVNPKGILFAITTFASFAELIANSTLKSIGSSFFLTFLMFAASSTWALTGAKLSTLFINKWFSLIFNLVMAIFLIYSAYSILAH